MTTSLHTSCYNDMIAWIRKHRRSITVAAVAVSATVTGYYAFKHLMSAGDYDDKGVEDDDKIPDSVMEDEISVIADQSVLVHFASVQSACNSDTLPYLLEGVREGIEQTFQEGIRRISALRAGSGPHNRQDQDEIWRNVKIYSFSRAYTAMLSLSLAYIYPAILYNILGRRVYMAAAAAAARHEGSKSNRSHPEPEELSISLQKRFICLSNYFVETGVGLLAADCESVVGSIVARKDVKALHNLRQVEDVFISIHYAFLQQDFEWEKYLIPPSGVPMADRKHVQVEGEIEEVREPAGQTDGTSSKDQQGSSLDHKVFEEMVDEARDVVHSSQFLAALAKSIEENIYSSMVEFAVHFGGDPTRGIKLAKLMNPIAYISSSLLQQPLDRNIHVQRLGAMTQLTTFCQLVYSNAISS